MKKLFLIAALLIGTSTAAYAGYTCTTTCYGNSCTTNCR